MLTHAWSRPVEEAGQLLRRGRGRGPVRSSIGGSLSRWRMAMLLRLIAIAIEHLTDAFGTPGVRLPVVQHPRPAGAIRDGIAMAVAWRSVGDLPKAAR